MPARPDDPPAISATRSTVLPILARTNWSSWSESSPAGLSCHRAANWGRATSSTNACCRGSNLPGARSSFDCVTESPVRRWTPSPAGYGRHSRQLRPLPAALRDDSGAAPSCAVPRPTRRHLVLVRGQVLPRRPVRFAAARAGPPRTIFEVKTEAGHRAAPIYPYGLAPLSWEPQLIARLEDELAHLAESTVTWSMSADRRRISVGAYDPKRGLVGLSRRTLGGDARPGDVGCPRWTTVSGRHPRGVEANRCGRREGAPSLAGLAERLDVPDDWPALVPQMARGKSGLVKVSPGESLVFRRLNSAR